VLEEATFQAVINKVFRRNCNFSTFIMGTMVQQLLFQKNTCGDEASAGMIQPVLNYSSQYHLPSDGSYVQMLHPPDQYYSSQYHLPLDGSYVQMLHPPDQYYSSQYHLPADGSYVEMLQPAEQYCLNQHVYGDETNAGMLKPASQYSSK
jgi:hypothetical protein